MKKFIYYTVRILCALPALLAGILTICSFTACFIYWWCLLLMPILGVTTIKLMASYNTDVEEAMKLIHKIRKDLCD